MPTALPRHQVTETAPVHEALETARAKWPGEPTSKLITRLVIEGHERIAADARVASARRRRALEGLSDRHPWTHGPEYLDALREDWPE